MVQLRELFVLKLNTTSDTYDKLKQNSSSGSSSSSSNSDTSWSPYEGYESITDVALADAVGQSVALQDTVTFVHTCTRGPADDAGAINSSAAAAALANSAADHLAGRSATPLGYFDSDAVFDTDRYGNAVENVAPRSSTSSSGGNIGNTNSKSGLKRSSSASNESNIRNMRRLRGTAAASTPKYEEKSDSGSTESNDDDAFETNR